MKCFFCDIQSSTDDKRITETDSFFSRFDDFPVSPGHAAIVPKKHVGSFFQLTKPELQELYDLLRQTKLLIDREHHPDGYNVGLNEGTAAGQTIAHVHVHLIPRYAGDVADPRGGIRNIIPMAGDYHKEAEKIGRGEYLNEGKV